MSAWVDTTWVYTCKAKRQENPQAFTCVIFPPAWCFRPGPQKACWKPSCTQTLPTPGGSQATLGQAWESEIPLNANYSNETGVGLPLTIIRVWIKLILSVTYTLIQWKLICMLQTDDLILCPCVVFWNSPNKKTELHPPELLVCNVHNEEQQWTIRNLVCSYMPFSLWEQTYQVNWVYVSEHKRETPVLGMFRGSSSCFNSEFAIWIVRSNHVIQEFRSSVFHFSPEKAAEDPS